MKLIIVLKSQDAMGRGGEILRERGMEPSPVEPSVFSINMPTHDVMRVGYGDSGWSRPEENTQVFLELLMDEGIKPMRVFHRAHSGAPLTPIHGSYTDQEANRKLVLAAAKAISDLADRINS